MQPLIRRSLFCLAVASLVTALNASCLGGGCQGDEAQLMQRLFRAKGGASGKYRELLSKLTDVTGVSVKSLDHAEEVLRSLPMASQINYDASKIIVNAMIAEAEEEQKIIMGQANNMSKFADCEGKLALAHAITDASVGSAKTEELMLHAKKCQGGEKPCTVMSAEPRLRFRHEATDRGCKNWKEKVKRPDITTKDDCAVACANYTACESYEWAERSATESRMCGLYMNKPCQVRSLLDLESENIGYNQYFKELICSDDTKLVDGQCLTTCQIEAAELSKRKDSCVTVNQAAVDAATSVKAADTKEAAGDLAKKATVCARACEAENTEPCEGVLAAANEFTRLMVRDIQVSLEELFKSAVDKSAATEAARKKLRCETQLKALEQSKQDCMAIKAAKKNEADALCKVYSKVLGTPPELETSADKKPCDDKTAEEQTRRLQAQVEKAEEQLKEVTEGKSSCEKANEELAIIENTCKEKAALVEARAQDCAQIVAETLKTSAGVQLPKPNHKPCAAYKQKKEACLAYNECYAVAKGVNEYSVVMTRENADVVNRNYRQLKRLKCLLEADVSLDDCEKEAFHSDLSNLYLSEPPNKTACEENLQVCTTCDDMPHCRARGWRKHLGRNDTICPEAGCDDVTCCQPTCVTMASCSKPGFVKDPQMDERTCPEGGCDDDTCCKPTCASMTTCDTRGFIPDVTKSTKDCSAVTGCTDSQCCMATCASMSKCQTEGFVKDCQKKNRTCIPGVGCDDDTCCKATCSSMKACKTPGLVRDKTMDLVDCPAGGCDDATCCLATCSTMESCPTPGFVVDKTVLDTECGRDGCDHATCCKPTCASITECSQRGFVRDPSKNSSRCAATGCDDATCCQPTCKSMCSCKKPGFVKDTRKDDTSCPEGGCDDDTCCESTCESYNNCHGVGWVKNTSTNSSLCRAGEKCDDATCCMPTCHSHTVCEDPHFVKDFTKGYVVCPVGGCTDAACCKPTCGSMATCVSDGFVKDADKDRVVCPPSGCNDDTCCMQTCSTMESCSTYGFVKDTRKDTKVCPKSGCDDQTCCKATCTSMSECTGLGHVKDAEMNSTDCPPEGCDDDTCCTATCSTMNRCAREGYVVAGTDTVCPRTGCTHEQCCHPTCSSMSRCAGRGVVKDATKDDALCPGGQCDDRFCCKPTCETMQSCSKPGYAKNLSAASAECPSTGCDDDTCCQPTCASMTESLTAGWVKDTTSDAKICPDTGCDDATCSKPTCLSMEKCSAAGYFKDPNMDSMVCGPDGCDDDTCCRPTCASMQVCSLGFSKKPSSDDTLCGTQGCDDTTCCQSTCASMQGCSSEDFYKVPEKDTEVCPASGCDDATCCKSMIQKNCADDDFQDAALVMKCDGDNGTVHYKVEDGVVKLIADLPKTATNVRLSTATDSARYLDVKLVDPATGKCVVGYSGLGCQYSGEGDHEYEGMTIYYTGDAVKDQYVKVKGELTAPLEFHASPWSVITKNPTGVAGYSYDLIKDCPRKAPGCKSCSEYTGCDEGKTPICDGTYKVKCQ